MKGTHITIVGCGVSGLTCGIRLLSAGFHVKIVARDLPPHTTSNIAAAVWYPYRADPQALVKKWGRISFATFKTLLAVPEAGVSLTTMIELFTSEDVPFPDWHTSIDSFRPANKDELPHGYQTGHVIQTPLIETPIYMRYLMTRFQKSGGVIEQKEISDFSDLFDHTTTLIINCSGLGAQQLAHDAALYPIRGQIVRIEKIEDPISLLDAGNDHGRLTYIIPRTNDCVLGGSADDNQDDTTPDPDLTQAIIKNCRQLRPDIKITYLETLVGLRPGRKEIRLAYEELAPHQAVIHNYGHGGAGLTLSWGCAEDVLQLVQKHATAVGLSGEIGNGGMGEWGSGGVGE